MEPPLIVNVPDAEPSSNPAALPVAFPTAPAFTGPPVWVYVIALPTGDRSRLEMLSVPPSIVNVAPTPQLISLPAAVPTVIVPCVTRSEPLFTGEPACPAPGWLGLCG